MYPQPLQASSNLEEQPASIKNALSPSHASTHTNPYIRTQTVPKPFEPCLDNRERRPGRLYRSNKPKARIRALDEALPRGNISFTRANPRPHV